MNSKFTEEERKERNKHVKAFRDRKRLERYYKTLPEYIKTQESPLRKRMISKKYYYYYCHKKASIKNKKTKRVSELNWRKAMIGIFSEIAERMVENRSGVFMENWGYFGMLKYPRVPESIMDTMPHKIVNPVDGGVLYMPTFIPIRKDTKLDGWVFGRNFSRSIVKGLTEKLYEGHKYTFSYSLMRAMYGYKKNK